MNNKELVILAAASGGGGGGGGGGEVTPGSIVTATGQMTASQKQQTRSNLNVVSTTTMGAVYNRLDALETTVITVSGSTVDITPLGNHDYHCGELTALTITDPPAQGIYSIVFTSGSTPTVTTIPASIIFQEAFAAAANTRYEINVLDGYAVVGAWPTGVSA